MYKLRYLSRARDDLATIDDHITKESGDSDIGLMFTEKLRSQCRKIASVSGKPFSTHPILERLYYFYPYKKRLIFFRYKNDELQIIRILHEAQDLPAVFREEVK